MNALTEAANSKDANKYESNMRDALAACVILSIMGGIDVIILFGIDRKLKNELSAMQYAEQSPQQHIQQSNIPQQTQARFCSNCGAEIQPDCCFCVHCGKKL